MPCTPAVADGMVYIGSYDGKFYALNEKTGAVKWKFATGGERRFERKGLHGMQPKRMIADAFDVFFSSPVVVEGAVYFGSGDGHLYALDAFRRAAMEVQDRRRHSRLARFGQRSIVFRKLGQLFLRLGRGKREREVALSPGEDALLHNQVGFQSSPAVVDDVVYTGCRDAHLYALDAATGKEKWKVDA